MDTPKQTKSERTRLRILDAAARILSERGYAATRLEDIAAAADTKAGSLYYHFSSREELVMEVLRISISRIGQAVRARVRKLPKGASFREKIAAAIDAQLFTALGQGDPYTASAFRISATLPPEMRRRQLEMERDLGNFWRRLLQRAQEAGEIDPDFNLSVLRMHLLGSIAWSIEWYRPDGALDTHAIAAQLARTFFDGVASRGSVLASRAAA